MRMRKKKNLSERLLNVKDILFEIKVEDRNFNTAIEKSEYIDFDSWFNKKQPLFLEIGCGKGKFACLYAQQHPELNIVAVEKSANVITHSPVAPICKVWNFQMN